MMTRSRYNAELEGLRLSFGDSELFKFYDMDTDKPYLKMAALTNSKTLYTLRVDLDEFPESIPKVFVTKMLKSKDGRDLDFPSHEMHTLRSEHGYTRICHFGNTSWTPNVALNRVYLKCRVWLEAYEAHLQTGDYISDYLGSQD